MNHQHIARGQPAAALRQQFEQIDRTRDTPVVVQEKIAPPVYGGPQRDAINSVIDGIVQDMNNKVGELQRLLADIEQRVLESAAKQKQSLNDHVSLCIRLNDEIVHARDVIHELKADIDPA